MLDSQTWLVHELFVPALALSQELSKATSQTEAVRRFACDKHGHWRSVKQALLRAVQVTVTGRDLNDAIRTIDAIQKGTETQCNTYPEVAIYLFGRRKDLEQAAQHGWTAAKNDGTIPKDPFPASAATSAGTASTRLLQDLLSVQSELERWNSDNSPSVTGYVVEAVPEGHPLHSAIARLQQHYGGALPEPAIRHWRKFLKLVRDEDEGAEKKRRRLLKWIDREIELHSFGEEPDGNHSEIPTASKLTPKKTKRSTVRGEGQAKLIAALTKHHNYADGSCLNWEPIGNNELARLAEVSESTASTFFKNQFGGHAKYRSACRIQEALIGSLKTLNQEFTPRNLVLGYLPGEDQREDEE